MPGIRADLESLIRIPSVSAHPAADAMLRSADAVAALFAASGLERVEVVRVHGGQPAVLGHRPGPAGADDEAGIALHLAALGDDLRVGVTVLIDGEEETAHRAWPESSIATATGAPPMWPCSQTRPTGGSGYRR